MQQRSVSSLTDQKKKKNNKLQRSWKDFGFCLSETEQEQDVKEWGCLYMEKT